MGSIGGREARCCWRCGRATGQVFRTVGVPATQNTGLLILRNTAGAGQRLRSPPDADHAIARVPTTVDLARAPRRVAGLTIALISPGDSGRAAGLRAEV